MTGTARVVFVVAVAENGVIGRDGQLPWRMPTDLKRFRKLTLGNPVIMGRKTYESIGKPLDKRDTIVLTSRRDFNAPGVQVAATIEEAIALGQALAAKAGVGEVAIIGGAGVFRAGLPHASRVYLTLVYAAPEGDTTFDALDPTNWAETAREPMAGGAGDQFPADFIVLDRKA